MYDERFARALGPLTPRVLDLFERFERCGDPHFGFLRLRCEGCAHERLLPFSCKARGLCPSCGKRRATEWALRFVEEVLPAPGDDDVDEDQVTSSSHPSSSLSISSLTEPPLAYLPLVFTIPKMLRPAFLFDRRLSRLLCRAAYAVVRDDFAERFPHLDRPVPAFVAAPQSFGTLLTFHPHVHALVSSGVFDRDGVFHPIPADEATARLRALELSFRDAVLDAFRRRDTIDDDRAALLRSWEHSGFSVHAERAIPAGDDAALTSLLEYFARPAVSERRLTHLDTGLVHYQGTFHPGLGRDHQLWTGVEFLAHLVPHIQHRYECRIHTYGALSTLLRKRFGWVGRRPTIILAGEEPESRAHDTSDPPQVPRDIDGASDGAHSPTATTPAFRVDPVLSIDWMRESQRFAELSVAPPIQSTPLPPQSYDGRLDISDASHTLSVLFATPVPRSRSHALVSPSVVCHGLTRRPSADDRLPRFRLLPLSFFSMIGECSVAPCARADSRHPERRSLRRASDPPHSSRGFRTRRCRLPHALSPPPLSGHRATALARRSRRCAPSSRPTSTSCVSSSTTGSRANWVRSPRASSTSSSASCAAATRTSGSCGCAARSARTSGCSPSPARRADSARRAASAARPSGRSASSRRCCRHRGTTTSTKTRERP